MKKKIAALLSGALFITVLALPVAASYGVHEVQPGDSLWKIAQAHQITIEQLVELNPDVSADNLQVGQKLQVSLSFVNMQHQVQPNETLQSIATQYQVPVEVLVEANELESARVYRGQVIAIPVPDPNFSVPYYWQADDSYTALAERYNTTEVRLKALNYNRAESDIEEGDMIFLPAKEVHIVKSGETIARVANQYGVTVEEITQWNNLEAAKYLMIGQKLIVAL